MLNKSKAREYLQDNDVIFGNLQGEGEFHIIQDWATINNFPGLGKFDCNGDFEKVLGMVASDYPINIEPVDFERIQIAIVKYESIEHGQETFLDVNQWELSDYCTYLAALDTIKQSTGELDDLNQWVLDEHVTDKDWGFSDEYSQCKECAVIIRTQADSYGWTLQGLELEFGDYYNLYCKECAQNYKGDCIELTQQKITSGQQPSHYPDIFDITDNWIRVTDRDNLLTYHVDTDWVNGLHPGQDDNPLKQGQLIQSVKIGDSPVFQVIYRIAPSQFDVSWNCYIRVDPNLNIEDLKGITGLTIEEWAKSFASQFSSSAKDKYSMADLMKTALQSNKLGNGYNQISVNPDTGDIQIINTPIQ